MQLGRHKEGWGRDFLGWHTKFKWGLRLGDAT